MTYPYPYREASTPKHRGHTSENPRIGNVQCPGCEIVVLNLSGQQTTKCPRHAPGVYAEMFAKHKAAPNLPA